ncbi:hypothetical protein BC833DRAFT_624155 [Globomyces pollinis-pini]|nr:hypothetical protein BC833DRAFT_624155 [Globomyces pollinis-pini]
MLVGIDEVSECWDILKKEYEGSDIHHRETALSDLINHYPSGDMIKAFHKHDQVKQALVSAWGNLSIQLCAERNKEQDTELEYVNEKASEEPAKKVNMVVKCHPDSGCSDHIFNNTNVIELYSFSTSSSLKLLDLRRANKVVPVNPIAKGLIEMGSILPDGMRDASKPNEKNDKLQGSIQELISVSSEQKDIMRSISHSMNTQNDLMNKNMEGNMSGSANYKEADTDRLLLMVARVLPTGSNEWEQVGNPNPQLTDDFDIEELESQLSSNNSAPQSDNLLPVYDLTLSTPNNTQETVIESNPIVSNNSQTPPLSSQVTPAVQRLGVIPTTLSQTAQRKRKIDQSIESISSDSNATDGSNNWFEKFMLMQSAQELKYKAEERQFKLELAAKEEERIVANTLRVEG